MQFSTPPDVDALSTRLPPLTQPDIDEMLPSISTLTGVQTFRRDHAPLPLRDHQHFHPPYPSQPWPSQHEVLPVRQPPHHPPVTMSRADSPATMDLDCSNNATSVPSPARHSHTSTNGVVNIDDPDVRLAAEALGDLRADFISSPPDTASLAPLSPKISGPQPTPSSSQSRSPQPQHEPLLSLLTTAHPLVASTIGGASSAYGGAKNFSPRFKSSAEYVEGYLTPIANTVNSVGRVTGVEGGVRWFLGGNRRQSNAAEANAANGNAKKRRKVGEEDDYAKKKSRDMSNGEVDADSATSKSTRRSSSASTVDTLPAYDEIRSPAYTETSSTSQETTRSISSTTWQSRLMTSTSGLSVAMSAESLKSLKYCLRWLRWTNDHMSQVIGNLKMTLEEHEQAADSARGDNQIDLESQQHADGDGFVASEESNARSQEEQARHELTAKKINILKVDVLKTLQETVNTVSKYAGGALPENARVLVRRHLTSLPQRFRVASMTDSPPATGVRDGDSGVREGGQKVLVLAKEGLDMVTQIIGVLDGTIVSAEEWCERMGQRRASTNDAGATPRPEPAAGTTADGNGDVIMAS